MTYLARLRRLQRRDRVTGWFDAIPGLGAFLFMLAGLWLAFRDEEG